MAARVAERLRQALDAVGLSDTVFTTCVIAEQAEAERSGFTGSPTILIDGCDPFAEPGYAPGLDVPGVPDPGRPGGSACP
uniref:Thioredoxin-like fold domain-containing protein n=1 Tax=Streptomyces sp. NBC_00003 TaxID=2903608 RepID=A0AAU2UVT8_9ACTN